MNNYKSSAELKALAKEHMFGKYGTAIGASVLASMITGFLSLFCTMFLNVSTGIGVILNFLVSFVISVLTGLFTSGSSYLYLKISCGRPIAVSDIFYGFKLFPNKALFIQLYRSIWIYLGMLPMTAFSFLLRQNPQSAVLMLLYSLSFLLYGVVWVMVSLIYSQVFFLLHDFPNYSVKELLVMSRKLMKGSKGRFFYMMAGFIPLMLLCTLSCGIAYLWLAPYINTSCSEFFLDLIQNRQQAQKASEF
ncbi:MAG: DUF975 family protein [Blautia sp.]|nr:DUF975 family protein [Blautia sp.]MCM1199699.1 DUF975 family protein [Bacteroides fragilis]